MSEFCENIVEYRDLIEMERNFRNFTKNFNRFADFETFVRTINQEGHSAHSLATGWQELIRL